MSELKIVSEIQKAETNAKQFLLESTIKSEEKLSELVKTYSEVEIVDKSSFDFLVKGSKEMKKIRGIIEKNRKQVTKPLTDFQKNMISLVKPWIETLSDSELILNEKIKAFEDIEKAKAAEILAKRIQLLSQNGFDFVAGNYVCGPIYLSVEQIESFSDADLDFHVYLGAKEVKRKEVEEKRRQEEKEAMNKRLAELERREAELAKREAALIGDKKEVDKIIDKIPEAVETKKPESVVVSKREDGVKLPESEKIISSETIKKINSKFPEVEIHNFDVQSGFDNFRIQLLEKLKEKDITRGILKEWAQSLTIKIK